MIDFEKRWKAKKARNIFVNFFELLGFNVRMNEEREGNPDAYISHPDGKNLFGEYLEKEEIFQGEIKGKRPYHPDPFWHEYAIGLENEQLIKYADLYVTHGIKVLYFVAVVPESSFTIEAFLFQWAHNLIKLPREMVWFINNRTGLRNINIENNFEYLFFNHKLRGEIIKTEEAK